MPKRYHISEEQVRELEEARKKTKDKNVDRRLQALLLHAEGKKHKLIAERTEFAETYISELVARYRKNGVSAIVENHYPGNHRNMSFDQEKALLEPFMKAAAVGQVITVGEIKRAYEETVGRSLENNRGQIYNVLRRHGWRNTNPKLKTF